MNTDKITTNYYKVLEILYENQITIKNETYCPLGQEEIAEILNCNRMTINAILKELKEDKMVIFDESKKKKYILSEEAIIVIKKIKRI